GRVLASGHDAAAVDVERDERTRIRPHGAARTAARPGDADRLLGDRAREQWPEVPAAEDQQPARPDGIAEVAAGTAKAQRAAAAAEPAVLAGATFLRAEDCAIGYEPEREDAKRGVERRNRRVCGSACAPGRHRRPRILLDD